MKKCINCGYNINYDANFCPNCGMIQGNNNYQVVNNSSMDDNNVYGVISLLIGIACFIAPGYFYLTNTKLAFNLITYLIILGLEIFGIILGAKCKKSSGSKIFGIIMNVIAMFGTTIILLVVAFINGLSILPNF